MSNVCPRFAAPAVSSIPCVQPTSAPRIIDVSMTHLSPSFDPRHRLARRRGSRRSGPVDAPRAQRARRRRRRSSTTRSSIRASSRSPAPARSWKMRASAAAGPPSRRRDITDRLIALATSRPACAAPQGRRPVHLRARRRGGAGAEPRPASSSGSFPGSRAVSRRSRSTAFRRRPATPTMRSSWRPAIAPRGTQTDWAALARAGCPHRALHGGHQRGRASSADLHRRRPRCRRRRFSSFTRRRPRTRRSGSPPRRPAAARRRRARSDRPPSWSSARSRPSGRRSRATCCAMRSEAAA